MTEPAPMPPVPNCGDIRPHEPHDWTGTPSLRREHCPGKRWPDGPMESTPMRDWPVAREGDPGAVYCNGSACGMLLEARPHHHRPPDASGSGPAPMVPDKSARTSAAPVNTSVRSTGCAPGSPWADFQVCPCGGTHDRRNHLPPPPMAWGRPCDCRSCKRAQPSRWRRWIRRTRTRLNRKLLTGG